MGRRVRRSGKEWEGVEVGREFTPNSRRIHANVHKVERRDGHALGPLRDRGNGPRFSHAHNGSSRILAFFLTSTYIPASDFCSSNHTFAMSRARGAVPILLATGFGVANG